MGGRQELAQNDRTAHQRINTKNGSPLYCRFGGMALRTAGAILVCLGISMGVASASPYDDCILQYMGNAQNKEAVYAIERSCISKSSVPISEKLTINSAHSGSYNNGFGSTVKGLVLSIVNNAAFDVTEIVVTIVNKTTKEITKYAVTIFLEPTNYVYTGVPEPGLNFIKTKSSRTFLVDMNDLTIDMNQFGIYYDWELTATKGIPN
jgi:hypothetical protein